MTTWKTLCKSSRGVDIKWNNSLIGTGGPELSKIYDSLLETPSSKTPPTASSRSGSVSHNSATIRWGWRKVSPKYLVQNHECCLTDLNYLWSSFSLILEQILPPSACDTVATSSLAYDSVCVPRSLFFGFQEDIHPMALSLHTILISRSSERGVLPERWI